METQKNQKQYQQGDVLFITVEVPVSAEKSMCGNVIRRGETTGHSHLLTVGGELQQCYMRERLNTDFFATIPADKFAVITHEEHKPLLIEESVQILPTHEYDHFAQRSRFVRD